MQFKNRYFRKFPKHLLNFEGKYFLGKNYADLSKEQLVKISDKTSWEEGESFLPNKIGKYSTINADGKEIVRRDLPKVWNSASFYYTRTEWHGDMQVEVEDIAYRHYQRYEREILPAQNETIKCLKFHEDKILAIEFNANDTDEINLHKLNLALEIFGQELETLIVTDNEVIKIPKTFKVVNWEILRSGHRTKEEVLEIIQNTVSKRLRKTIQPVIKQRFATVQSYEPTEVILGVAGFKGYVIFQFPNKGIAVLECDRQYNATYIFDYDNWEQLSKLSKTEILESKLAKNRIIHDEKWQSNIHQLLN